MMGGGEGGPALTLIHRDEVESVGALLDHGYFRNQPSHMSGNRLQVCAFGAGARIESLSQSSG
jgi:galactokinase